MVSGELYIADDPHLHALGAKRRRLQHEINPSAWDAFDERTALFRELFGAIGEGSHIEPPFRCDYGCNITIGHGFYANTDCIILDVAPVTIGDNVFRHAMRSSKAAGRSASATTCGSVPM